jgi:hypothetical protein
MRSTARSTGSRFVSAGKVMCAAQRIDLKAAREGRITWQWYFQIWGKRGLAL